jgi:hypothetical protein
LPGLTYSFSKIEHGSLSNITFRPGLNSLVEKLGMKYQPRGVNNEAIIP